MAQTSAYFKVTLPNFGNRTYVGQVKEKDCKLSYSGEINSRYISAAARYSAKAAVAKAWPTKDPEVFSNIEVSNDGLVETLRKHTQDLLAAFLDKTKASAARMFEHYKQMDSKPIEQLEEIYGIQRKEGGRPWEYANNSSRMASLKLSKDRKKWDAIVAKGFDTFLAKELDHANEHYEISLLRLAQRLDAKGIKGNFTAVSGKVGQNFEVVINHGDTVTRAWTIIAEGPIVRAHYRYLVK